MVIKKGTCLFFLSPYFWRYVAIIIAIKVIAIRCEPNGDNFHRFSKNLCFSDNSIHTKNFHCHRFIAIIIAIRSEPTFNVKTPWMTVFSPKIFCTCQNNKRKRALFYGSLLEEDYDDYEENEQEQDMWNNIATLAEVVENKPPRKVRTPDNDREIRKLQWEELYRQKSNDEFADKMRISRTTFNTILNNMWNQLVLHSTNFKQNPTLPDRQLALTLYRLAHGVT